MSPEASETIVHIVNNFLLGIGQSRKHPWGRFPGNFSLFGEIPHGITRFFEFPKNLGYEFGSGAAWPVIFDPVIFDIHPKSKNLGHMNCDSSTLIVKSQIFMY
jgi:hypothetical protein